jgi:hypothetical protein
VSWATPHMLRHGLASLMAEQGYSAAQIAAQLGHAGGGVLALRTYVHPALHAAPSLAALEGGDGGGNRVATPQPNRAESQAARRGRERL